MARSIIEFRRMSEKEFASFLSETLDDYSRAMACNFKRQLNRERIAARKQVRGLLINGVRTKGHLLLAAVEVKTGIVVGNLWVHTDTPRKAAFLYDIVVVKRFRGRGYGLAIMKLLDATLKGMRMKSISLHVFAENSVALRLYRKQGYRVASCNMIKEL